MRLAFGDTVVDLDTHQVQGGRGANPLTPLEAALLRYLAERRGQVVSQQTLHTEVWGYAPTVASRAAYHAIARLRRRLEPDPSTPRYLVSVRGAGFRLNADVAPPVAPLATPPRALPRRTTRFFGRARELATICERILEGPTSLVSIVGIGGIGKTRLALEALARLEDGVDHVVFCDLGGVAQVDEACTAILEQLGQPDRAGAWATLAKVLAERGQAVLALDGVERLAGALTGPVAGLLEACPALKVLTTGRTDMGLHGELRILLDPLPEPPLGAGWSAIRDNAAVQLFADRVALHDFTFDVNDQNAAIVNQIVTALGGWPLALELAAAQCAGRSIRWLAAELPSIDALTARARDVPARHRTLGATLSWTWALLSTPLREGLQQLTCFPGGVDEETARAILGAGGSDCLQALHGRGLARVASRPEEPRRYGMLDPIRQWVRQEQPASSEMERRLVHWAAERCRACTAVTNASGPGTPVLDRLKRERTNLERALDVALEQRLDDASAEVAVGVGLVAWNFGHHPSALRRLRRALQRSPDCVPLLHRAGLLASTHEPVGAATQLLERAVEQAGFQALPNPQRATILQHLAKQLDRMGLATRADELYEEALTLTEPGTRAELAVLGTWSGSLGNRADPRAVELGERAAALCRDQRDHAAEPGVLHNLAKAYLAVGRASRARDIAEQALRLATAQQHATQAMVAWLLAETWLAEDRTRARTMFGQALELASRLGDQRTATRAQARLALVHADRRDQSEQWLSAAQAGVDADLPEIRKLLQDASTALTHGAVKAPGSSAEARSTASTSTDHAE